MGHTPLRHDPCDQIDAIAAVALLIYSEVTAMEARHNLESYRALLHNRSGLLWSGMHTCVRIVMTSAWQPTAASSRSATRLCIGRYSAGL